MYLLRKSRNFEYTFLGVVNNKRVLKLLYIFNNAQDLGNY